MVLVPSTEHASCVGGRLAPIRWALSRPRFLSEGTGGSFDLGDWGRPVLSELCPSHCTTKTRSCAVLHVLKHAGGGSQLVLPSERLWHQRRRSGSSGGCREGSSGDVSGTWFCHGWCPGCVCVKVCDFSLSSLSPWFILQPKCGFLPVSRDVTHEVKHQVCRHCMHQRLKVRVPTCAHGLGYRACSQEWEETHVLVVGCLGPRRFVVTVSFLVLN